VTGWDTGAPQAEGDFDVRLRVLHIGKYFPPHRGGMETFLRDLATEQCAQGMAADVLVHSTERRLRTVCERPRQDDPPLNIIRVARWFNLSFAPISPLFPLWIAKRVGATSPSVIHIHMPNVSAFWCLLLPRARRVPWVIHWHADVLASQHKKSLKYLYWLYRPFEQALLRRAARIIATSPPYLTSSRPLEMHRDRCTVVPLGIRDATSEPDARTSSAPQRDLRVLFVGRLTYYKGLSFLIEAVSTLPEVELRIVGQGEQRAHLEALAARRGAGGRIAFLGDLTDTQVSAELDACHCLCLPSIERTEAFGVVLLEAMRKAKALVVTTVAGTGMSWVSPSGVTGLSVAPEDAEALTDALRRLRDEPGLRTALGVAARARFETCFRISEPVKALRTIYRAVQDPDTSARSEAS